MAPPPVCTVSYVIGVSELSTVDLDNASADVVVFALRRRKPFSLRRFNPEALDFHWIKPSEDHAQDESITSLGPSPERELRM